MALEAELERQGNWLFRWRSYLPLSMLVLVGVAMHESTRPFGTSWLYGVWQLMCIGISFVGLAVRCATVGYTPRGTSGRNTRWQVAESLNTTGIYSVVRHPLYLGNYVIGLGVTFVLLAWWLPAIYTLVFWLYYERIMFAEERFLRAKFGGAFDRWSAETPAFSPRLTQWRRADLGCSLRNIFRREYTGLLLIVLMHCGIEIADSFSRTRQTVLHPAWLVFALTGITTYVSLRTLKKRTTILDAPGR